MRRIVTTGAAALLGVMLLAGCGGDDSDDGDESKDTASTEATAETTESGETGETGETSPADEGDCGFLSTDAVAGLLGDGTSVLAATEVGCSFESDSGASLAVTRTDIAIDAETYATESRNTCEDGTLVEVDAGDDSFACEAIGNPVGWYFDFESSTTIGITPGPFSDVELTVDDIAGLTEQVTL